MAKAAKAACWEPVSCSPQICRSLTCVRVIKCSRCQYYCGPLLSCFIEYSGSIQIICLWTDTIHHLNQCLMLQISSSVESRWSLFCKICSCGRLLSALHHFDWCVYLNPQHLSHGPKEADSCSIIHRLGSPCQGWQQSSCVFWMLVCRSISFRTVVSLGLANRLRWCYMWNMKISSHWERMSMGDKQTERMCHHHGNCLPRTLLSCYLNQCCLLPFQFTRSSMITFQGTKTISELSISSLKLTTN